MTAAGVAWVVIVVTGILTFAARGSFLLVASRLESVPAGTRELLRMIPPAALAALVAPALLVSDGRVAILGPRPLAGLVALVVAWRSRSVLLTVAVGMVAVVAFELLLG